MFFYENKLKKRGSHFRSTSEIQLTFCLLFMNISCPLAATFAGDIKDKATLLAILICSSIVGYFLFGSS